MLCTRARLRPEFEARRLCVTAPQRGPDPWGGSVVTAQEGAVPLRSEPASKIRCANFYDCARSVLWYT